MNSEVHTRISWWITALPRIAGVTAIAVGACVLVGWIFDVPILKSLSPDMVSMKPNAALAFVLAGASMALYSSSAAGKRRIAGRSLYSLILLIGLITIAEYVFTWDAGIDQLLFHEPQGTIGTYLPGRMAFNSAINFSLFGLALLMLGGKTRLSEGLSQVLALLVGLFGMLALIAYTFGLPGASGFAIYTRMALHTAVTFILLSGGLICLQPDIGLMAVVRDGGSTGHMARRMMFAAVVVPVALGWVVAQGEMLGMYGNQFGDVIDATIYIAVFVFVIWAVGRSLITMDVERRRLEQSVLRSEKEFKELFDNAPVGYHELDAEGRISRINQTELKALGYREDEMLGHFSWEFVRDQEQSRLAVRAKLSGSLPPARGDERIFIRKDGTTMTVMIEDLLLRDALGRANGIRTILQDITELKRAQEQLKESEVRHRTLFQNLGEGIGIVDEDERFVYTNPGAEKILGVPAGGLIGRNLREFMEPDEFARMREQTNRRRQGETTSYEIQMIRVGGMKRDLLVTVSPYFEGDGTFIGAIGIFRDITQDKIFRELLVEKEKASQLTADIAAFWTQNESLSAILKKSAEAIVLHMDAAFARIWTLNRQENVLELQASAGLYTHFDGPHGRVPVGKFKIGLIAAERKPHVTNTVIGDPRVGDQEWARREGIVSFAGYPLMVKGEMVGVFALFGRRPLSEFVISTLEIVAEKIANGIEHKHAEKFAEALLSIAQAVHSTNTLEELFEHIHRDVSSIMPANNFFVALVSGDETRLEFPYVRDEKDRDNWGPISVDDGQSLTVEVFRSGRSLMLNGKELEDRYASGRSRVWGSAPKCWLGVPLVTAGKIIGVMAVQDYVQDNIYSPRDMTIFESAAGQIALAIGRKKSEASLKQSVSLLQATLESTADGILAVDKSGKFESYNKEFVRMWTIPDDIVESRDDDRALNHVLGQLKEPDAFISKVRELYAHPDAKSFDLLEFKDGRVFERYSLPQYVDEEPVGRVWSFRDITARRKAEQEIKLLAHTIASTTDCVSIGDLEDRFIFVNSAFIQTYGYTRDELLGQPVSIVRSGQTSARLGNEIFDSTIEGGWHGEVFNRRKDGNEFPVELWTSVVKDDNGNVVATVGIARDITKRKQAEDALAKETELFRLVSNLTTDYIFVDRVLADGKVELDLLIGAVEQITGYTEEEYRAIGSWSAIVHPDDQARDEQDFQKLLNNEKIASEIRTIRKDGSTRCMKVYSDPIWDEMAKRVVGICGAVQDITDQKQAEQERESLIGELKGALEKVRTLGGLLPICASCKKIRDDKGYWNQLEKYLGDHTDAKLTHGLCPDCAKIYFPDAAAKAGP